MTVPGPTNEPEVARVVALEAVPAIVDPWPIRAPEVACAIVRAALPTTVDPAPTNEPEVECVTPPASETVGSRSFTSGGFASPLRR